MRKVLVGSCNAVLVTSLALYGIAVPVNAQVTGAISWWPYWWLAIVAAVAVASAVSWIALTVSSPSVRRSREPDFVLTRRGPQLWELRRTQRTHALALRQNDGIVSATRLMPGSSFADLAYGEKVMVSTPNDSDCYVWFDWIEGGSRFYSTSEHLTPDVREVQLKGIEAKADQLIQT